MEARIQELTQDSGSTSSGYEVCACEHKIKITSTDKKERGGRLFLLTMLEDVGV